MTYCQLPSLPSLLPVDLSPPPAPAHGRARRCSVELYSTQSVAQALMCADPHPSATPRRLAMPRQCVFARGETEGKGPSCAKKVRCVDAATQSSRFPSLLLKEVKRRRLYPTMQGHDGKRAIVNWKYLTAGKKI